MLVGDKLYPNPLLGSQKGISDLKAADIRAEKLDLAFDLPEIQHPEMRHQIAEIRPATVIRTDAGFEIASKGALDLRDDLGGIHKALKPEAAAMKLPEFPKMDLPAFRR